MKKYLIVVSFSIAALIMPNISSAATVEELQAQINVLVAQIQALQAQMSQQQPQQWCYDFNKNLRVGDGGIDTIDIKNLHEALSKEGFSIDSSETTTNSFGESTAAAVSGFQQKYKDGILTPLGLRYSTGFFGKATRAKLNTLYGCGGGVISITPPSLITTPTSVPTTSSITVLAPNGGEKLEVGKTYLISWKSTDQNAPFGIYLSDRDEFGQTGIAYTIAQNVKYTTSYNWTIPPSIRSGNYLIRVVGYPEDETKSFEDYSNLQFSIVSSIPMATINSFNVSAYIINSGETINFSWSGTNVNEYKLYFGTEYGIGATMNNQSVATQQISMGLKTSASAIYYNTSNSPRKVSVLLEAYSSYSSSDSKKQIEITVNPPIAITATVSSVAVLAPNGGETFIQGNKNTISWKGGKNKVQIGLVKAPYDLSTGYDLVGWLILDGAPDGSLVWDGKSVGTPGTFSGSVASGSYKIVAISENLNKNYCLWSILGDCNVDISDNPFSIAAATSYPATIFPTITSPGGGEKFQTGQKISISWDISNMPTNAFFQVSFHKAGGSGSSISPLLASNVKTFGWTVPSDTSAGDYYFEVSIWDSNVLTRKYLGAGVSNKFSIVSEETKSYSNMARHGQATAAAPCGYSNWQVQSVTRNPKPNLNLGPGSVFYSANSGSKQIFYDGCDNTSYLNLDYDNKACVIKHDARTDDDCGYGSANWDYIIKFFNSAFGQSSNNQMANVLESMKSILIQISESLKNSR